jgi:hypothetical protein
MRTPDGALTMQVQVDLVPGRQTMLPWRRDPLLDAIIEILDELAQLFLHLVEPSAQLLVDELGYALT